MDFSREQREKENRGSVLSVAEFSKIEGSLYIPGPLNEFKNTYILRLPGALSDSKAHFVVIKQFRIE